MGVAGVLRCPACGAGVQEGARRCTHCDAPVATLRCAACFHMSAPDAVHCSGCGRDLGLEPIPRHGSLACVDCRVGMSTFDCGPGLLHDCDRCGGQFVEHAALRQLLERHDGLDIPIVRSRSSPSPVQAPVRYVACPACRAIMNRKNFGAGSGVIVDVCSKHGTWFDRGELPRVLAFVESGGLARARRRQVEDAARETRGRAVEAAARSMHEAELPVSTGGSILGDLLHEIFGGF